MRLLRSLSLLAAGSAALLGLSLQAQVSAVSPRIAGPVDETALTVLKGNVSPLARAEFDKGEASPSTEMREVRLVLSRSAEQEAALDKLMAEQLDKSSPNYQRWLTPQEFNRQFGVADSDLAAIHAWLESHGLKVDYALSDHTTVAFSGTVRQIEDAFHTAIHQFEGHGQSYLANTAEPQIPAALSSVVSGVAHLNTFHPVPQLIQAPAGSLDPNTGRFTPNDSGSLLLRPEFSFDTARLYAVPGDAATIYNTPNAYNAGFTSGTSYTGKGVTIGVVGQNTVQQSTVLNYRGLFLNGDTNAPTMTNVGNSAVPGPATDEAYLDLQISGGLAPGAAVHYYAADPNAGDIFAAAQQAYTDNTVDILSVSYGQCEYFLTTSDNTSVSDLWKKIAAAGIAVLVSTGDSAAAGCDDPNNSQSTYGLQVNGLATTPYNIAVGGTDYQGLLNGGFSTYVNSSSSASISYRKAKSYIPESTWNDSVTTDGLLSANQPYLNPANLTGGGGGVSACTTNSTFYDTKGQHLGTCTSGYAKPSWQRGPGVPNDNARDIPDISLLAGNGFDRASWLVCTDDTDTSTGYKKNCTTQGGAIQFNAFGGTSTSAPAMAGILALVQEKMGGGGQAHRLGLTGAKTLYDLYTGAHASAIFHDTTAGNNSVPCSSGTPNCKTNTAGNLFLNGYDTGTGYDLATGLGSVDATALITYWGAASGANTATVAVTAVSTTIDKPQALNVSIAVSGSAGTPTGSVTLAGGGYTSAAATLDANGKATINIPSNSLNTGNVTLTASYAGDSNYASASGTLNVTVNKTTPTVTVTPSPTTITADQSLSVTVAVTGNSGAGTGTVTLSGGGYPSTAATLSSGSATITIPANSFTATGTVALTAAYSGDSSYNTASGTGNVTVNPAKLAPTVTVTTGATNNTITSGQSLAVTVKVTGTGATPTGKVTLTSGSYTSSQIPLDGTGSASINVPANTFTTTGSVTLTATYTGDGVYTSKTGTASITVNEPYTVSVPNQPAAVSKGGSSDVTVNFKSDGGYAGNVTVSCTLKQSPSGAQNLPGCSITAGSTIVFAAGSTTGTPSASTVHITTTAATSASLEGHGLPAWAGATGGSALALLVFFGIPARRRSWRNLLGLIVVLAALGSMSACGGGGNNNNGGGGGNPGTTSGNYVFTVTGTGSPAISPAPSTTITLTVN